MGSTGQAKNKSIKMQRHLVLLFCAKLPDGHLKFECSILHSNVEFYFKFDDYSKFNFILTALVCSAPKSKPQELPVIRKDGYVEVCILEIYRDKPVLGSNLWHDFSQS